MRDNVHAISAHGHVYHIEPIPEHIRADRGRHWFRWQGYKDGQRWRLFHTKSDFEAAAAIDEPDPPRGPHARDADVAEMLSTQQGLRILDAIRVQYRRRVGGS
jgi:hypothetical protein